MQYLIDAQGLVVNLAMGLRLHWAIDLSKAAMRETHPTKTV